MSPSHFFHLLLVKVGMNLRSEAATSHLNYVWWLLEPALYVAVFYVVFGTFLHQGNPNFVAFLMCGNIPFLWYSRSVTNSSNSLIAGRGLISQVSIPKAFFPLAVMLQDCVKQAFVFVFLLVFLAFYGIDVKGSWLYLPVIALTQAMFIVASGLVAATIVPLIPDFRYIITTGMMLLMFGSGVFYSYEQVVRPQDQAMFLSNPMAALIKSYRQVLLGGAPPDFDRLLLIAAICVCVAIVACWTLTKFNGRYSRLVMQ